jgi:hypothetical protein
MANFIVACIADKYPAYLKARVSSSKRRSNMEFLRNRIIEAGICGGLDLGWNLKRWAGNQRRLHLPSGAAG